MSAPESCDCYGEANELCPIHGRPKWVALVETVEKAMQTYWDNWCSDTGCVPSEFSIRGPRTTRVYADFRDGGMSSWVAEAVQHFTSIAGES